MAKASNPRKFSPWNRIFHRFAKIFFLESFPLYGVYQMFQKFNLVTSSDRLHSSGTQLVYIVHQTLPEVGPVYKTKYTRHTHVMHTSHTRHTHVTHTSHTHTHTHTRHTHTLHRLSWSWCWSLLMVRWTWQPRLATSLLPQQHTNLATHPLPRWLIWLIKFLLTSKFFLDYHKVKWVRWW